MSIDSFCAKFEPTPEQIERLKEAMNKSGKKAFVRTGIDPHGKSQHETGAKLDAGKVRPSLIIGGMPRAMLAVARVGTYGAEKYTEDGWRDVPDGIKRYTDAMDRHRLQEAVAPCDDESGLLHAAHLAWNALARLELMLLELMLSAEHDQEEETSRPDGLIVKRPQDFGVAGGDWTAHATGRIPEGLYPDCCIEVVSRCGVKAVGRASGFRWSFSTNLSDCMNDIIAYRVVP